MLSFHGSLGTGIRRIISQVVVVVVVAHPQLLIDQYKYPMEKEEGNGKWVGEEEEEE